MASWVEIFFFRCITQKPQRNGRFTSSLRLKLKHWDSWSHKLRALWENQRVSRTACACVNLFRLLPLIVLLHTSSCCPRLRGWLERQLRGSLATCLWRYADLLYNAVYTWHASFGLNQSAKECGKNVEFRRVSFDSRCQLCKRGISSSMYESFRAICIFYFLSFSSEGLAALGYTPKFYVSGQISKEEVFSTRLHNYWAHTSGNQDGWKFYIRQSGSWCSIRWFD